MSDIVNSSLRTAAKGTGLVLAGSAIALLLGFVNKLLIIRNTTQAEFGIFSLAIALVSIAWDSAPERSFSTSTGKLRNTLGWEPSISIEEGASRTFEAALSESKKGFYEGQKKI